MLQHYLQVVTRSLLSHKLYSFINILGFSVALTCVVFVILFVRYELSFDQWIPETQRLYRLERTARFPGTPPFNFAPTPYPLARAMRDQISGVTGVTRLQNDTLTLIRGNRQFLAKKVDFVDSNFFQLIRLPFIVGDPETALRQPESVVLSQSAARRYFGTADPIGRTLTAYIGDCPKHDIACSDETVSLRVTGIVRDLPQNTQLTGNTFIPIASLTDPRSAKARQSWFNGGALTYVTLAPDVAPAAVLAAIPSVLDRDMAGVMRKAGLPLRASQVYTIHLTPFTQVHFSSTVWLAGLTPPESRDTLYGVIVIGILVLMVACFNFTNLSTARATLRAREIALRKTLGASRRQLRMQFLMEALFLALVSLICAAAAAEMLLPVFNGFLHQSIVLNYGRDWRLDIMLIGVAIGTGLLSGIYPALVLSRLRPVAALQAEIGSPQRRVGLRDVLVLMQFAVSISLGITAMVVFRQVDYARRMNYGFRWNNIVVIHNELLKSTLAGYLTGNRQEAFAEALRANSGVSEVGLSFSSPFGGNILSRSVQAPGKPSKLNLNWIPIGPDYPRTYGIALVAGRLLSPLRGDDRLTSTSRKGVVNVLVNVAAATLMGFTPQDAVGKTIMMDGHFRRIVGVLGDTKTQGARAPVVPTVYAWDPSFPMNIAVRLRPGRIPQTLAFIDQTWHAFVPTVAIQRLFLSSRFARLYRSDERQGTVFGVFVIIAIFIACLGLYGLVVFTAERRTKEVAVRKISGARTLDIMEIMLWQISVPVLLGNVIAWPLTYYYLQRWLQAFADHIWLNPAYFFTGGGIALLIAWATVFVHTLRLARTSPIHALRYE